MSGQRDVDILMKGIAAMMAMLFGALILTSLLAFALDWQARLGPDEADGTPAAKQSASLSTTAGRGR